MKMDPETKHYLAEYRRKKRGIPSASEKRASEAARICEVFNVSHPVGTPICYWSFLREGRGVASRTCSEAQVTSAGTAVVWVEGYASCIALSHVEPLAGRA